MRVLPGIETWTGLQGWAPGRVTPKQWALASFRAKLLPLSGWAGQAAFCLLILSSPRATAWSRPWSPVGMLLLNQRGLQCPWVWPRIPLGPSTNASLSHRMSLRHHGFRVGAAGRRLLALSPFLGLFLGRLLEAYSI